LLPTSNVFIVFATLILIITISSASSPSPSSSHHHTIKVWEESVISTPSTVLMVALSATVRNVRDITGWFTNVHGQPTSLVSSDFR
jgi:hypothetical protein